MNRFKNFAVAIMRASLKKEEEEGPLQSLALLDREEYKNKQITDEMRKKIITKTSQTPLSLTYYQKSLDICYKPCLYIIQLSQFSATYIPK